VAQFARGTMHLRYVPPDVFLGDDVELVADPLMSLYSRRIRLFQHSGQGNAVEQVRRFSNGSPMPWRWSWDRERPRNRGVVMINAPVAPVELGVEFTRNW